MASIKALDKIASKYGTVTPQRTQDYADGVENPKKSWSVAAKAAEGAYKEGVTKAATAGRFGKGVAAAGDQKWAEGAKNKGVTRWGQGVQLGQSAYQEGFAPFHSAISSATLPARYAKRDPRNLQRVAAIVEAINKVKESQSK